MVFDGSQKWSEQKMRREDPHTKIKDIRRAEGPMSRTAGAEHRQGVRIRRGKIKTESTRGTRGVQQLAALPAPAGAGRRHRMRPKDKEAGH